MPCMLGTEWITDSEAQDPGFHWEKFSGLHNSNYLTLVHSEEGLVVEAFYLLQRLRPKTRDLQIRGQERLRVLKDFFAYSQKNRHPESFIVFLFFFCFVLFGFFSIRKDSTVIYIEGG